MGEMSNEEVGQRNQKVASRLTGLLLLLLRTVLDKGEDALGLSSSTSMNDESKSKSLVIRCNLLWHKFKGYINQSIDARSDYVFFPGNL
jgi:hypothetical protein